jgi:hypothetical protein
MIAVVGGVPDELRLLDLHRRTAFTFDERGRMTCESAPNRSRGKRFSFAGCRDGNLGVVRDDVPDAVARELERLLADEPPLFAPDATPRHVQEYVDVLGGGAGLGLLWVFPGPLDRGDRVHLVWSGSGEGEHLLRRFGQVVRAGLAEAGFHGPDDLWEPWCVALVDGEVASIAETVRRGEGGAEVGVDTDPVFRGRGLGAAATAGWSRHPHLAGQALFYSTSRENTSSRRVTERLGLRFLGSTFALP